MLAKRSRWTRLQNRRLIIKKGCDEMKILGQVDKNKAIIEITADEIANLAGFPSEYYLEEKIGKIEPGKKFEVSNIYKEAKEILKIYDELKTAIKSINTSTTNLLKKIDLLSENRAQVKND